ncbi:bifunctional heptose 7-phosphate kinase/heptose 1-phosphate adenyltransferase [Phytoactinopolyspora alkaliphila]|uniref:Bifunctional heptose 7-phosphate kinase/heptose 1-phosphate adenyltransferase n=1 Tax=Phytoactinopolyspora alkaliphila TaxID=1783498 RepID=A0A6N9YM49_9ACTN|nr:PfkB family carbohydrate kinase [Phytoactinopolyspora alkaliphila]NED95929.1 bifunctional heptose 7-phosphate kinase/heptose 1-phosphate adenyltransferase [Phytoactinopolyspora alkaliphila]
MRPRVVVAGDALLDVDVVGVAKRLSPDAPVPVVDDVAERLRPGGAALAACLLAARGADVTLIAPLPDDDPARRLHALLEEVVAVRAVPCAGSTPVKKRVRAGDQSIVRLDSGGEPGAIAELPEDAAQALASADAVLVSDYGRGMAAAPDFRAVLQALPHRPPIVWDPHPRGAHPVPGVTLATPNAQEATAWMERCGHSVNGSGEGWMTSLRQADALLHAWRAGAVAVTLGSQGALLSHGHGAPLMLPAPRTSGGDACGAGDAFAATATALLGRGEVSEEAVRQAVVDASQFVADGGAAGFTARLGARTSPDSGERPQPWQTDAAEVARRVHTRGGVLVATGGCFDLLHTGHVDCLQAARRLGDALIVCLNSDESVRRLKGSSRPMVPAPDRARILQALECVDAVQIFEEDTPAEVLRQLRPHVWAKGGDYAGAELPEQAVVAEWDGHVVTLPYIGGWSTSALLAAAQSAGNDRSPIQRRSA